jgi:hypothetical protein
MLALGLAMPVNAVVNTIVAPNDLNNAVLEFIMTAAAFTAGLFLYFKIDNLIRNGSN